MLLGQNGIMWGAELEENMFEYGHKTISDWCGVPQQEKQLENIM